MPGGYGGPGGHGGRGQQVYTKRSMKENGTTLVRLLRYAGNYRILIGIVLVFCLISNILALAGPSLAGSAISAAEAGAGQVDFDLVFYYARWMLICYLASAVMTIAINIIMMITGRWIGRQMRKDVFDKLMKLPVRYFDRNATGDIISRVSYDIDLVSTSISTDIVMIMTSTVTIIGSLVMMIVISPILSLTMLVTVPAAIFYTTRMSKITRPLYSRRSKAYGQMNGYSEEIFSGQKTVQAYGKEDIYLDRFEATNAEASDAFYKADSYGRSIGPTVGMINNIGMALIGMFGGVLYLRGSVSLGNISSFILYARRFSNPINEIANVMNEIFSALSAADRVFNLLDEEEEPEDSDTAIDHRDVEGDVEVDHVSFGYDPGKEIIHDFNMKADPGKMIAIVGETGAGKTTVINLLMRFYDVNSGHIRIDGNDIYDMTRSSVRGAYAMVLQDTWLFNGTIYENIAYGKENATREEVIEAAKAANIHHFIMQLPDGYDTVISEDGGNISKGQKQMLTIARAMLYDARMLILDEATSNVDTSTERQIQAAMRELMSDKTCFIIAHRLSTIQNADNILVVDNGNIVEQGTHAELMDKKGYYYKMYASQFE